jgi:hypothetical protein
VLVSVGQVSFGDLDSDPDFLSLEHQVMIPHSLYGQGHTVLGRKDMGCNYYVSCKSRF